MIRHDLDYGSWKLCIVIVLTIWTPRACLPSLLIKKLLEWYNKVLFHVVFNDWCNSDKISQEKDFQSQQPVLCKPCELLQLHPYIQHTSTCQVTLNISGISWISRVAWQIWFQRDVTWNMIMHHLHLINSLDAGDGTFQLWVSIPCLLMPWLLKSPEHQQTWY